MKYKSLYQNMKPSLGQFLTIRLKQEGSVRVSQVFARLLILFFVPFYRYIKY